MSKNTLSILVGSVILIASVFVCSTATAAPTDEQTKTIWLDELDIGKIQEGWGESKANKSIDGNPLSIGGQSFERGIGTHADSIMLIDLDGNAQSFSAKVGIDDEVKYAVAKVEFQVMTDDKIVWESGPMGPTDGAKDVEIDLDGVKRLALMVTDGGNGIDYDHADWAMAKIEYSGSTPKTIEMPKPEPYILTPEPGPEPRITGPKVFGVRPGSPILFTVTATGDRPIKFKAYELPDGVSLDPDTGQMRGELDKKGQYELTLKASNKLGTDTRKFRLVCGDTIALTPPMGWNSWNCWGCAVDAEKVRATAKAMVESGLINHGWSYINIDDCWMRKEGANNPMIAGKPRDDQGNLLPNAKFPDMKGLTDHIHALGLKAGTYISPGPTTCQGFEGSWEHEFQDAAQFAEWGFDYLKYDWCGYSSVVKPDSLENLKKPYELMREALDEVDRDIVYSICQYGWGDVWEWGEEVGGNLWRTTGDIYDSWSSMAGIGFAQNKCSPYAKPGHWNDPDMLVVGKVGWGPNLHDSNLSPDEQYTHISLWSLLSAPLLIGCPIEQIDEFTMNLLTNDEVLGVNQDPLGDQASRVMQNGSLEVWAKDMEDGSKALGFFNRHGLLAKDIKIDWDTLGISGKWKFRDLWRQKDVGTYSGSFMAKEVPAHGVYMVRIWPAK
ncbi:Alpha-galactosidase A precursor [Anaerohalosphaera lusitana]|uniref:Alpha-galactosidase n=1 Tax=Anaerohalosphaera lusitana TaxID=1936003 RepID=A0A1U9NNQ2_9BACT|nr:NPCBM/NEW2 domain-containing protein [Anaerohalosphaera lusitana]AQT69427.1 Alpha-galactosidase A precursor [Anaerohalosphaera lusitana]